MDTMVGMFLLLLDYDENPASFLVLSDTTPKERGKGTSLLPGRGESPGILHDLQCYHQLGGSLLDGGDKKKIELPTWLFQN